MKSLLADLDILMAVAGFNTVDEFDRSILEPYPKSYTYLADEVL